MTRTLPRRRFSEFVRSLGEERAFLAEHSQPALLLEPFHESSKGSFDTPDPDDPAQAGLQTDLGMTISDVIVAPSQFAGVPDQVHPDARVLWLVKSDRNPFAGMITLGRAKNNDIVLPHPTISKMHAIFHHEGERWFVEDRGSSNGTFLNGVKLPPSSRREVDDGATLRVADVVVARFFEPASFWLFCQMVRNSG